MATTNNSNKLTSTQEKGHFNANIGTFNGKPVEYSLSNLKKHFISLGSSGSGKTVLTKVLIEECALNKIPSIVVDLQGDLSSLAIMGDKNEVLKHGLSQNTYDLFKNNVDVTIFTPISTKGIPICINPLKLSEKKLPEEEIIPILHAIATSISKLFGYNVSNDKGKSAEAVLYTILKNSYDTKTSIDSFDNLASLVQNLEGDLKNEIGQYIGDEKELTNLVKKIKFMTVGEKKLIFQLGVSLDIDLLLGKNKNKTAVSVIYLNTLPTQEEKEFFITNLTTDLYQWMLSNPSDKIQCAYVIDEIAPFLPATSDKPMTKTILKLLFKQARKYGVACIIATQNPGDIDYKSFAQFGSWAIGRLSVKQDVKKVESALKTLSGSNDFVAKLPKLQPGQFLLFAPDVSQKLLDLKVRWLYTKHQTLNELDIKKLMEPKQKEYERFFVKESKPIVRPYFEESKDSEEEEVEEEKTTSGKKECFISLDLHQAIDFAKRKRRKMFWLFGPAIESVAEVKQYWHPYVMAQVKAKESFFGFNKKIKNYILFFDGKTGSLILAKHHKHKEFPQVAKLIDLSENQLLVAKTIMQSGKSLSVAEIVHETQLPQATVTTATTKLLDSGIIHFNKTANFKQWNSLIPFKVKRVKKIATKEQLITSYNVKINDTKVNITTNQIAKFISLWFKDTQLDKTKVVYLPTYKITYLRKNKPRTVILNGATKQVEKKMF